MSWLTSWWTRPALKIEDPQNSRRGKSDNWAGRDVGPQGAMQLAAFWSCVRLNSETISTLPLGIFQRERDGSKSPADGHTLYGVLHDSPNADQTAAEFWEGQVISLCLHGNG